MIKELYYPPLKWYELKNDSSAKCEMMRPSRRMEPAKKFHEPDFLSGKTPEFFPDVEEDEE